MGDEIFREKFISETEPLLRYGWNVMRSAVILVILFSGGCLAAVLLKLAVFPKSAGRFPLEQEPAKQASHRSNQIFPNQSPLKRPGTFTGLEPYEVDYKLPELRLAQFSLLESRTPRELTGIIEAKPLLRAPLGELMAQGVTPSSPSSSKIALRALAAELGEHPSASLYWYLATESGQIQSGTESQNQGAARAIIAGLPVEKWAPFFQILPVSSWLREGAVLGEAIWKKADVPLQLSNTVVDREANALLCYRDPRLSFKLTISANTFHEMRKRAELVPGALKNYKEWLDLLLSKFSGRELIQLAEPTIKSWSFRSAAEAYRSVTSKLPPELQDDALKTVGFFLATGEPEAVLTNLINIDPDSEPLLQGVIHGLSLVGANHAARFISEYEGWSEQDHQHTTSILVEQLAWSDPEVAAKIFTDSLSTSFIEPGDTDAPVRFYHDLKALSSLVSGLYTADKDRAQSWLSGQTETTRKLGYEHLAKVAAREGDSKTAAAALARLDGTDRHHIAAKQIFAVSPDLLDFQRTLRLSPDEYKTFTKGGAFLRGTRYPE